MNAIDSWNKEKMIVRRHISAIIKIISDGWPGSSMKWPDKRKAIITEAQGIIDELRKVDS